MKDYIRSLKLGYRWTAANLRRSLHQLKKAKSLQTIKLGSEMTAVPAAKLAATLKPFAKAQQKMKQARNDGVQAQDMFALYDETLSIIRTEQAYKRYVDVLRAELGKLLL